ncbi:MAG: TonB-dependent receptor [Deltaproteobacteria bacterium]
MKHTALFTLALLFAPVAASAQEAPPEDAPITKLPKIKEFVEAVYPPTALRDRMAAQVVLQIDLSAEGSVENVIVVSSATTAETLSATTAEILGVVRSSTITDWGFVSSATTAVAQMTFEPAEAGGVPVPVRIPFTYNFSLPPQPLPPPPTTVSTATVAKEPGPGIVNFSGTLRERGTRTLVVGAVVTVFRTEGGEADGFEAVTNDEGKFEFYDLTPGQWKVLAEAPGYYPLRTAETVVVNQATEVTYYIEKGSYNPYDVVVEATRVKKEVNRRTLTAAEIVRVPGTLGDPVQVVENLPGVARSGGGQIIVRGSGPQDTGVYVDGIEIPIIYHFGGLKSVLPADVIDSIDFYPGNFSVKYGRATGGIFDGHIRRLKPDQLHGVLDVSLLDTSLFLEVPIGDDAAIAVAGRRSYIGEVISAATPSDASVNLINAPVYYDYHLLANWRPNARHEFRGYFFGSDDVFKLLFENPAELSPQLTSANLSLGTNFQRGTIEYNYTPNEKMRNKLVTAVGRDVLSFRLGDQFRFELLSYSFQLRNAFDWEIEDWLTVTFGLDYRSTLSDVEVLAPLPPREGEPVGNSDARETRFAKVEGIWDHNVAPYFEAVMVFGDLQLVPGVRFDYFQDTDNFSVDPRIVARYQITKQWTAKAGVGVVHQAPEPVDTNATFGNPNLGLIRGVQYSVGAEWYPLDHIKIDGTLFYKDLNDLVVRVPAPLNVDNIGLGQVYGFELFLEHKFNDNFRGWLTYTLNRAQRQDGPGEPTRLFDFDQTHIVALVASYVLPENWEIGLRWRFVSGNPTTPFIGAVYNADLDQYDPISGPVNSDRLPLFHQLDLRVDKSWVFDYWKLTAYLSLINSYNRTNTEGFQYSFDFSQRTPVQGLPIFPILGVRGEF